MLSPLIALLVLYYVKASYNLQRDELKKMQEVLDHQLQESGVQTEIAARSALLASFNEQLHENRDELTMLDERRLEFYDAGNTAEAKALTTLIEQNIKDSLEIRRERDGLQGALKQRITDRSII